MNWYVTKIVYRIICGEGNHTAQFDEQLRLVQAGNTEEAYSRACEIGLNGEDRFRNNKNEWVQWKFMNVSELFKLPALSDGVELYSRVKESKEPLRFVDMINRKAEEIRSHFAEKEKQIAVIN